MHTPTAHDQGRPSILSDVDIFRRHPSSEDAVELRALINTNEASLTSLNTEIEACSKQLSALRTKAYAHLYIIRRCQAALGLARLLPSELLAKIFEHASEMGWTRAPVVVSAVCSAWRAAALSHPRVWSRITVKLDTRDPVGWTKHWLSMARQASLHLTLVHTAPTTIREQIMALLLERAEQWISLTLDLHLADTQQVLASCTAPFTKLRSISISLFASEDIGAAGDTVGFAGAFQDAPCLTSFSTVGNVLPSGLPPHLTSLCIEYKDLSGSGIETPRSMIQILQNLPDLEILTLRLGVTSPGSLVAPGIPDVELPRLRVLTYEDTQTGGFHVLKYITAPSLTHLQARTQPDLDADESPASLIPFLENSPNLEELELSGVEIWPAQWLSTLPLLPKLRRLHLHDSDVDDTMIEQMFGEDGLCPNLQKIDLRWCHHIRGTTLVQLVKSRTKDGVCAIEEVAAISCSLVRKQDIMQLASLTTFRVVIRDGNDNCLQRRCCDNERYRQRLKFHLLTLSKEERAGIRLIVD